MSASAYHTPVLVDAVTRTLAPALRPGPGGAARVLVDATCGGGGHTAALLEAVVPAAAVLIDRDPRALAAAKARLRDAPCPVHFVHARFSQILAVLAERSLREVACILADLGVSSHQLDTGDRGFSFRQDAPLDMRMDPSRGRTAAEIIAESSPDELARILRAYGEEPEARRIADAITRARPTRTHELARVVTDAMSAPARRRLGRRIHPATRTFQALRILVNGELEELDALLRDAPGCLAMDGRLGIISFHSLEDRRVKQAFRKLSRGPELPRGLPVPHDELPSAPFRVPAEARGGLTATDDEARQNPRARSARLRVLERCAA